MAAPSETRSCQTPAGTRFRGPEPATRGQRILAAGLGGLCLGVLALAAFLSPSGSGHGTHTQIGMPPCMWAATLDAPCPTCGMTTAFAHAGNGSLVASLMTQPMGFLLSLATAAAFWGALHVAVTGSRLGPVAGRLLGTRLLVLAGVLTLAAWAFKLATWTGG